MKLHTYIKIVLTFFYSKFLLENNEIKANAVSTLISQWDKFINGILLYESTSSAMDKAFKAELHSFILGIKKNKNLFESNDKRLILRLIALLQAIRVKDIKSLLLSDLIDVRSLGKILTEKRNIIVHYPTGKKKGKKDNITKTE